MEESRGRRFAVLLCAEDSEYVRKVYGGYSEVFVRLLGEEGEEWDVFRVARGELPRGGDAELSRYDGFVITGSCNDAHGDDEWIADLLGLVRRLHALRKRVLGVCFGHQFSAMYDNLGSQAAMRPPLNPQPPNPFGNALYGAGSDLIRGGLSAYGEIPGLKLRLYAKQWHWTRITEPVGGRLSYKPPIYDINAPDLYIPFMAFGTYVILAGFSFGLLGKFTPEALSLQFTRGLGGWFLEVLLLKGMLYSLGGGEAPLLDIVAYAGYAFTGLSVAILGRLLWGYSYYFMMPWVCLWMGVFLVKTMKRVLFTEMRSYEKHSSRHHYLLLFMAIFQFPLFFWLGNFGA